MANGNPVLLGKSDGSTRQTTITAVTPSTEEGLRVQNLTGTGIAAGSATGTGLTAGSLAGTGLFAESFAGSGVVARCVDARDIPGISTAVLGTVPGGFGVMGVNSRGRFPESGVTGRTPNAIGVDGISTSGFGVRGMKRSGTLSGAGVMAIGAPGHGLVAIATQSFTSPPLVPPPPFTPSGPLFAGLFMGNVQVQGDFTVIGSKAAAVPHPDGTHRRLYCVEAPEAWFEDFGAAELVDGRASVALEETFAALVLRTDYHVFLTPEGDCRGLYVATKTKAGFEVRELQGGASTLRFSYRVVARRRDAPGERLAKVQLGAMPEDATAVVKEPKPPRRRDEGRLAAALMDLAKRGTRKKAARKRT